MTPHEQQLVNDFDLLELGVLGPEEAGAIRSALRNSDDLAARFKARPAGDLLVAYSLCELAPSQDARDNFLFEMRHTQAALPVRSSGHAAVSTSERKKLFSWPAWAMAAVALLLFIVTGILLMQNSAYRRANDAQSAALHSEQQQLSDAQENAALERDKAQKAQDAQAVQPQMESPQEPSTTKEQQVAEKHPAKNASAVKEQQLEQELAQARSELASARTSAAASEQQISGLQTQVASSTNAAAILSVLRASDTAHFVLTKAHAKPQPQIKTYFRRSTGQVVLLATNLPQVLPGKAYELWLIPADGTAPVPAGTFHPDAQGNVSITMAQTAANRAPKTFAVTIEEASGATTPTMPIAFSGSQGF